MTLDYAKLDHTYRRADPTKFENGVYRNKFGDAASENFGTYFNSSFNAGKNTELYMFGGFNYRFTDAFAFSRAADEERNVKAIYPHGFDPAIQSVPASGHLLNWNDNGDNVVDPGEKDTYKPRITTDVSVGYNLKNFAFTIGGVNILNVYPDKQDPGLTESA